jgi:hypothetical protein
MINQGLAAIQGPSAMINGAKSYAARTQDAHSQHRNVVKRRVQRQLQIRTSFRFMGNFRIRDRLLHFSRSPMPSETSYMPAICPPGSTHLC